MKTLVLLASGIYLAACTSLHSPTSTDLMIADTRIDLAIAYLQHNQRVKARENLLKAQKAAPLYKRTLLILAYYHDVTGETDKANQIYHTALSLYPENPNLLNNYGTFLCKQGLYAKALNYFRKAYRQPDYAEVADSYENAGLCARQAHQSEQAEVLFQKALRYAPEKITALSGLIQINIERRRYQQAETLLQNYLRQFGTSLQTKVLRAQILQALKEEKSVYFLSLSEKGENQTGICDAGNNADACVLTLIVDAEYVDIL